MWLYFGSKVSLIFFASSFLDGCLCGPCTCDRVLTGGVIRSCTLAGVVEVISVFPLVGADVVVRPIGGLVWKRLEASAGH